MKKFDTVCIGDIYGKMLNPLRHTLRESKKNKNAFGDQPKLNGKGPHTSGYHKALNDEKKEEGNEEDNEEVDPASKYPSSRRDNATEKMQEKLKNPNLSEKQKEKIRKLIIARTEGEAEEEKSLKESRKNNKRMINSIMSKSVFDKLYSKVLKENFGQDDSDMDNALNLNDATPDDEFGDDEFGDDEDKEDSVTFTLDRATAQTLIDVLQGAIGEGGEDELGEDDDLDFGDDEGDDMDFGDDEGDDMDFEEDEQTQGTKPAVDKKKAFQSHANKVAGHPAPKGGKAKTDVTDDCGTTDGAPPIAALQGKSNQVPGSTLKKSTDYFR